MSEAEGAPVSERLGFANLVDKVAAQAPRRDAERLLLDDRGPSCGRGRSARSDCPAPTGADCR